MVLGNMSMKVPPCVAAEVSGRQLPRRKHRVGSKEIRPSGASARQSGPQQRRGRQAAIAAGSAADSGAEWHEPGGTARTGCSPAACIFCSVTGRSSLPCLGCWRTKFVAAELTSGEVRACVTNTQLFLAHCVPTRVQGPSRAAPSAPCVMPTSQNLRSPVRSAWMAA